MTNAFYGQTYYATTVGIISKASVVVKAISQYPAAVQDAFSLAWWDEANPLTSGLTFNATASSGTVTDTDTGHDAMTSTVFPAGGVVQVTYTNGDSANKTYHLIGTAGNNDRFIVTPTATWADEATINYTVKTYPARVAFDGLQPKLADTLESKFWFFGDAGIRLPNLILSSISNNSHLIIYIE
jgi:hypothetical protein